MIASTNNERTDSAVSGVMSAGLESIDSFTPSTQGHESHRHRAGGGPGIRRRHADRILDELGDLSALLGEQRVEFRAELGVAGGEHARLGPVHERFVIAIELA